MRWEVVPWRPDGQTRVTRSAAPRPRPGRRGAGHRRPPGTAVRAGFFRDLLAHHYTGEQVDRQLETATDRGRHAGLFGYDAALREYRLDEESA